jgi:hypothetical protein
LDFLKEVKKLQDIESEEEKLKNIKNIIITYIETNSKKELDGLEMRNEILDKFKKNEEENWINYTIWEKKEDFFEEMATKLKNKIADTLILYNKKTKERKTSLIFSSVVNMFSGMNSPRKKNENKKVKIKIKKIFENEIENPKTEKNEENEVIIMDDRKKSVFEGIRKRTKSFFVPKKNEEEVKKEGLEEIGTQINENKIEDNEENDDEDEFLNNNDKKVN